MTVLAPDNQPGSGGAERPPGPPSGATDADSAPDGSAGRGAAPAEPGGAAAGPRWQLQLPLVPPRPGLPPIARPPVALQSPRTSPVPSGAATAMPAPPPVAPPTVAPIGQDPVRVGPTSTPVGADDLGSVAPGTMPEPASSPAATGSSTSTASPDSLAPVVVGPVPAPPPSSHPTLRLAPPAPLLPAPPDPVPAGPDDDSALEGMIGASVGAVPPLVEGDLDLGGWEPAEPDRRTLGRRRRRAVEAPRRARRGSTARRPAPAEAKPWTRVAIEWLAIVAGALVTAMLVKALLLQAFVIPSRSMEPTLDVGDRVLVFKQSYSLGEVDRGDVIVFARPAELRVGSERSDLIKRVIGLPGDVVEAREGRLLVNGAALDEPWLPDGARTDDFGPVTVPEGRLWVMGDNRGNSQDSRYFGFLDIDTIRGEAFLRWWPLARFGAL